MPKEKTAKELEDLPGIGPSTAEKLRAAGYDSIEKIAAATPHELADVAEMSVEAAKKAVTAARESTTVPYKTAEGVFEERKALGKITTGSKALDALLGGGIESNGITEVYGRFAAGKTQLGFQISVNVQLPFEKGGLNGTAMFIDTENTFRPERIEQMAAAQKLDVKQTLNNIFVVSVHNVDEQILAIERADKMIVEKNIKLIVIDSLIALFRAEFIGRGALGERQQKLNMHIHKLLNLAEKYNLAAYVTNQVMDNPAILFGDPTTPVGGNIVAHAATTRLYIRKGKEDKRIVRLVDSPNLPEGECVIKLTADGIRD
ncbi:MAG: DNA repair and recombination protein RadA [Candidatus Micrarchaeaceae archaeon]